MLNNCSLNDGFGPCESQARTFSLVIQGTALLWCDYKYRSFMSIRERVTQHTLIKQIIDSICLETFSTVLGLVCVTSKTMQNKHKL